jgi:hypothetical protein
MGRKNEGILPVKNDAIGVQGCIPEISVTNVQQVFENFKLLKWKIYKPQLP